MVPHRYLDFGCLSGFAVVGFLPVTYRPVLTLRPWLLLTRQVPLAILFTAIFCVNFMWSPCQTFEATSIGRPICPGQFASFDNFWDHSFESPCSTSIHRSGDCPEFG